VTIDEAWRTHHSYLVDLAFRMLGDVGEAEDVVQEAFYRLSNATEQIEDDRGWLTVVTGRLCLDLIRSARARREHAQEAGVIEALAPAVADPADRITLDDTVRMALFVVLERLSAAERVAFVLHDVFRLPFESIAQTLGKPVMTCRQLARRARNKIADAPLRLNDVAPSEHRAVTEKFMAACTTGDVEGLLSVLHPDVWGDAQFTTGLAPRGAHGSKAVANGMVLWYGTDVTMVSHGSVLLAYRNRELYGVLTLTIENDLITKIDAVVDPVRG
jgi:RNA polymerase sigma-70 factor (ECF subfamily)